MLGPDGSAQPLLVSAPPGAEAPAGTRCSAPHPPSGSRRCKVTGKSTGWKGRTQPRSRSFPGSPSLQHASLPAGGGDGPEAGCAQALACCCRASLGAQHPVVLQGPNACTPNTAGKGLSPHLHRWMLQGCRDSGTAGCAEQLNHTSPCQDVLERREVGMITHGIALWGTHPQFCSTNHGLQHRPGPGEDPRCCLQPQPLSWHQVGQRGREDEVGRAGRAPCPQHRG